MERKRNSYLVSVSMRNYLVAAVISMLIQNLNTIIDGVLMGRLLGVEAFSAINLCLPVVGLVATLGLLLYGGATTLASMALGSREEKKANQYYSVSLISVVVVGVVFTVLTMVGLNAIARIVCLEDSLRGYVKDYMLISFVGSTITMLSGALLSFAGIAGRPKVVTVASLTNIVVNIACDVIYVAVFHLGIRGAALATLTGSLISMLAIIADFKMHGSMLKLERSGKDAGSALKDILVYGFPVTLQSLAVVVYSYVCTFCSQKFGGVNGAFAGSLLTQVTSLCQGVSGGVEKSFNAIGGLLAGQKDYKGVNLLFKKGIKISIIFSTAFALLVMIFVPGFAAMMGATSPEMITYSTNAIRMALLFVVPISIVWIMPSIYAIAGALAILPVISIAQPVCVGIGLVSCGTLLGNDRMWLGYPLSAIVILLILVLLTEGVRKKSPQKRSFFSLLPNEQGERNVYDISVACDEESLVETLKDSNSFFDAQNIENRVAMRVRLCVEELMKNIIEFASKDTKKHFLDLKIVVNEENILAIIKDDGVQFNPITAEEKGYGLKLIHGLCPKLEYQYSYGQNMVFMTWDRK